MRQHSVQLGTQHYRDGIWQRLLELRDQEELPVMLNAYQVGKRWFIQCTFEPPPDNDAADWPVVQKVYRHYLANAIAETILKHWELDYASRLLRQKYRIRRQEWGDVFLKVKEYLDFQAEKGSRYFISRKANLVSRILAYLETESHLDIEGFLRFRARDYVREVEKLVGYAVDDYLIDREYREFIQLLKHFVDSQPPKLHTLHVGIDHQGRFHLYNEQGEIVTKDYIDYDYESYPADGFAYEDLLISALIAVAPRQVVLHIRYDGYQNTLQTVVKVFENRVSYCTGCALCSNWIPQNCQDH